MDEIKARRRWLRFSLNGLLTLILLAVAAVWYFLAPLPVEYHPSTVDMEYSLSQDNPDEQQKPPALIAHWRVDPKTGSALPNGTLEELKIDYSDRNGDGIIDKRLQWRSANFGEEEVVYSDDWDHDGFFDKEEHRYLGLNSIVRQRVWTQKVHIPVPKTKP